MPGHDYRVIGLEVAVGTKVKPQELLRQLNLIMDELVLTGSIDDWGVVGGKTAENLDSLPVRKASRDPKDGELFTKGKKK